MMKQRPKLMMLEKNAGDYDLLFIGTPVWAFRPVPAMSSFLESVSLTGKKMALFCCSGGVMGKTFDIMKGFLAGNTFLSAMHFVEPKRIRPKAAEDKACEWTRTVLAQAGSKGETC